MEPGRTTNVTVSLLNTGNDDSFVIRLDADASSNKMQYFESKTITPDIVSVKQSVTANISIEVSLMPHAPNYFSVTFTLTATSTNNPDINDFVTFDVTNMQEVRK